MFNTFNCRAIMGKPYLVSDLSSVCYDEEWTSNALLAGLGCLLYPLGIQLFNGALLWRNRHKLFKSQKLITRYGILFARYEA